MAYSMYPPGSSLAKDAPLMPTQPGIIARHGMPPRPGGMQIPGTPGFSMRLPGAPATPAAPSPVAAPSQGIPGILGQFGGGQSIQSYPGIDTQQQIYDPNFRQIMQNRIMADMTPTMYGQRHELGGFGRSFDEGLQNQSAMNVARGMAGGRAAATQQDLQYGMANQDLQDQLGMLSQQYGRGLAGGLYGLNQAERYNQLQSGVQGMDFLTNLLNMLGGGF